MINCQKNYERQLNIDPRYQFFCCYQQFILCFSWLYGSYFPLKMIPCCMLYRYLFFFISDMVVIVVAVNWSSLHNSLKSRKSFFHIVFKWVYFCCNRCQYLHKQTKSNKYNFKIMIICNDLSGMLFDLLLVWTWEQLLALMSYYHDQFSNNNYCKMYCFLINNHKIETHWEKRRFCFPKGKIFSWFSVFDYI